MKFATRTRHNSRATADEKVCAHEIPSSRRANQEPSLTDAAKRKGTIYMFRYSSKLMFALCLVLAKSSLVAAQVGAAPAHITIDSLAHLTVTRNGTSIDCSERLNPEWDRISRYTLGPRIGDSDAGRVDLSCGDIGIAIFHELTVTEVSTEETNGTIVRPITYDLRIAVAISYPDLPSVTVLDKTENGLRLQNLESERYSRAWSDEIKVEPGVRFELIADNISYEF